MDSKEDRIRVITQFYYSKPEVQKVILDFAKDREIVPRYFEDFGKRPDVLQYGSDVIGLVKKGATSFHASEELWDDALKLNSDLLRKELDELRKDWDLLIDIDSPFLDCSKIAARLILEALEQHGVKNYGIKFSGSKGFHIIVSGKAFPKEYNGRDKKLMFPEWPRIICSYLMDYIRRDYNKKAGEIMSLESLEKRTNLTKEDLQGVRCRNCGKSAIKGEIVEFACPVCNMIVERKNVKITKKRLKCLDNSCAGVLEISGKKDYYFCENCNDFENEKNPMDSLKNPEFFEETKGVSAEKVASLDLVLVASRHLFRMPYSLHEKTALASIVLEKKEIENFTPQDANPMNIKIRNFMPDNFGEEGRRLLSAALDWQIEKDSKEKNIEEKKYGGRKFDDKEIKGVSDEMFPAPIKKLMEGLEDGRKRGLFVLLTFLRNAGFSPEEINNRIRAWNEKNKPPLKEGYVRSQIEWNFKQNKKILPPNYSNDSFYRDLGLFKEKPKTKNPLVDVKRALWKGKGK